MSRLIPDARALETGRSGHVPGGVPQRLEPEFERAKPSIYHANGHTNVWVTELGSRAQNGSFERSSPGLAWDP